MEGLELLKLYGLDEEAAKGLKRLLGLPEDGGLPVFPDNDRVEERKSIYVFLDGHKGLGTVCRAVWERNRVKTAPEGLKTKNIYKDDPEGRARHWELQATHEELYNLIRAVDQYEREGRTAENAMKAQSKVTREKVAGFLRHVLDDGILEGDGAAREELGRILYNGEGRLKVSEAAGILMEVAEAIGLKKYRSKDSNERTLRNWEKDINAPFWWKSSGGLALSHGQFRDMLEQHLTLDKGITEKHKREREQRHAIEHPRRLAE